MECWPLMMMMMMILILMVGQTEGECIEEERNALLEIKSSHINSFGSEILPTWVDYGSSTSAPRDGGGNCCDWEMVSCNTTTGHVTHLSLYQLRGPTFYYWEDRGKLWALNVSLLLHFKELANLNLSYNFLDQEEIIKTGLERLSSLKKLEVLDLSQNDDIDNDILPSLKTLTSLKVLSLSETRFNGNFHSIIREFAALENLEMLYLSWCRFNGIIEIQGLERLSSLKKLEVLDLSGNDGIDNNILPSLGTLTSLKILNLGGTGLSGNFPLREFAALENLETLDLRGCGLHGTFDIQELSQLTNLEKLDLSWNSFNDTPNIQGCKSLSRLKRLGTINLSYNYFNKSIISCLSALPSLKILHLSRSFPEGISFPVQEFHNMSHLEVLILSENSFNGILPVEAFVSFHHLRVLDLSGNRFSGSVPSAIKALSSLQTLSFAYNELNGSLSDHGLCELKNLQELDLSVNMLDGSLPQCFNNLSFLKVLDISSNRFTRILEPSFVANLTSLEYIDFSDNRLEGSFSFSSFSNHTKLEAVLFPSNTDEFEVETEEPVGWIPTFQLRFLKLSKCNLNRHKGHVIPGFLIHQHKLLHVDMCDNFLEGYFPYWLIKNNMNLEVLNLRNNFFGKMLLYENTNMKVLDISGNHMIGNIPDDMPNFFPNIEVLNLSRNALSGVIPSSIGGLSRLRFLDLSDNELSGEVPNGLLTNLSHLHMLKLSKNKLHGQVLSGNLSWGGDLSWVYLDSNHFTGEIGIMSSVEKHNLYFFDIGNNFFTGMIPGWISNVSGLTELVVRNNSFEGRFPCGAAQFQFLDISQNLFSGPIPLCSNWQSIYHLHLGSNRFTGSIPNSFRNLTHVLTLDISNNSLSGRIPEFFGELSTLRILLLRKSNFSGHIPKKLCKLSDVSLLDLSKNSLSGSIPSCLQNVFDPNNPAFSVTTMFHMSGFYFGSSYHYESILWNQGLVGSLGYQQVGARKTQDEVEFTTKNLILHYKGGILNYMTGLDLSCNKLTGEIPEELGLLTQLHALNLSHNQLTGPIPVNFSNLASIESLDLSSNGLTGKIPSELVKLTNLSIFIVSHNNLSGRLPEMTAQFATFDEASYEGNPLLCGPPLVKNCAQVTNPSDEEEDDNKKLYHDIDMTCFYASSGSTCLVLLLGFVVILYINPQWRRRWVDWVEDCMFTCYYFVYDLVRKLSMIF